MVYNCINNILTAFFPTHCQLCGIPNPDGLCEGCRRALPLNHSCCRQCALPLPKNAPPLCGRCTRHNPWIERSLIPLRYEPPVDRLIGLFKFQGRLQHTQLLSRLILEAVESADEPLPECLIPVPLHPSRLRHRGFNQSLELARPLARQLDIGLEWNSCQRRLNNPPQAELPRRQRLRNLRGAFTLGQPLPATHVALVDDVVTTGSTVIELARLLKRSGVQRVDVWAVARTP